ncbi:glycoside hydrolase family 3 N-terminal domain-containing protein [Filimonas effusa]|uniref:beta-N-acetylhexosaminidase n=1 Tax=Filimonas effusa TaxID=2508721 RepID=A0A4Q1D2A2_9BACT|nr:glycoside hydrolase family 3 N-terminal domain-containing protein [Filimonas effusa]RXK81914.1 serine hydrolase [Filimonas effusa]
MKYLVLPLLVFSAIRGYSQQFLQASPAATRWVDSTFKTLSRSEKIAQLMVLRVSTRNGPNSVAFYDDRIATEIKKYNIGALCLFQGNPVKQAEVVNRLQALAPVPLMVCIDGETGVGMRFDSIVKFPDQLTLGAMQNPDLVYRVGKAIAGQCKLAGIQVNYAPVVDINNNPNNPVINFRSFGEDKYKVALFGTQITKGMQDGGIMACGKHFPGHGDVAVDSHLDLPVINKSRAQLDSLELYPFRRLISEGVGSMMVAHLYIPSIDNTPNRATSLSEKNVTGLLRNELQFKGITFTDAIEMQGVAKYFPSGEASVQSLIAGNDMLCLPSDVGGTIKKVKKAIRRGRLSKAALNEKVRKVLLAKYNLGLDTLKAIETNNITARLNAAVPALKKEVYENAITLLRNNNKSLLPLATGKKTAFVGIGIEKANAFASRLQQVYQADCFFLGYKADAAAATAILEKVKVGYDAVIVGVHQYTKYPANNFGISAVAAGLLQQLQMQEHTIHFVFGNPYAIRNNCSAGNLVACYEDDSLMHETATALLRGTLPARGTLPVTVCEGLSYGAGIIGSGEAVAATGSGPAAGNATTGLPSVIDVRTLNKIDAVAAEAIAKGATPGCVVLVAKDGKVVFNKAYGHMNYDGAEPVTTATVYDLASVTKISATTVSIMKLYEEGKIDLKKKLGDYLSWTRGSDKAGLTLEDVLLHQAGLVSWIPFYRETIDTATGKPKPGFYTSRADASHSVEVADHMYMRNSWRDTLYQRILQSKLGTPGKYVYSDNDFIFLGKIVEQVSGLPLDEYARIHFYEPLQMATTTFKPLEHMNIAAIAPTEKEKYFRLQLLRGHVHDPGAAMFGGVAGHAGLFSNAGDLAKLYLMLLNGGELNGKRLLKKETIGLFTAYHSDSSRRGLGFDKPEKDNASRKEPYPTLSASPSTFGHTGFTGTCVWADPQEHLLYIFLSNRVCPEGGSNGKLGQLNVRPAIHEIIYSALHHM